MVVTRPVWLRGAFLGLIGILLAASPADSVQLPDVLLITVDTLRTDRLSAYGYSRPTSPNLDRLLAGGARFDEARCVEPLTGPALASMITSLFPHEHGATRNGLPVRPGLASFSKILQQNGYETAAFVGNWTLKASLSRLDEHFDIYEEVFTRRRYIAMFNAEATAADLTERALDWIRGHTGSETRTPFLVWIHYVEPHAPYRLQEDFARRLKVPLDGQASPSDRYDTEIAFVDGSIGQLLAGVEERLDRERTLIIFAADHGESLGEHGYWGHGRHLYDVSLRIPMAVVWDGHIRSQVVKAPALLFDIAPTILGLLELPLPDEFRGFDWSATLTGANSPPPDRITLYQAHKGAARSAEDPDRARRGGLLEVGLLDGSHKEIFRVGKSKRWLFDLESDPDEVDSLAKRGSQPTSDLLSWLALVEAGLREADTLPVPTLSEEEREKLRALGYLD